MVLSQKKISVIALVLYWPMLLVFAHIPVPESVRSAHVSDKSLHFLAYLVLTFLLWFSIKPQEKVKWRKITVWLLLFGLTAYGAIDEVVQSFVGRSCDAMDIAANFSGTFFGLLVLTFLTFLPAALLISGIVIFAVANIARTNLALIFPVAYVVFHFFAYAVFTVFWLLNMNLLFRKKQAKFQWLILAAGIPICFLLIVRISSFFLGREIDAEDIIVPVAAVITVVIAGYLRISFLDRTQQSTDTNISGH